MTWISANERLPQAGAIVRCKVRHVDSKIIQEHRLRKVSESDCDWRTADDNSELSYDWSVIEWKITT